MAFQTLSDPTRFQIVALLKDGERPVNDIVREVGIHQSGVSRHLGVLHKAGFVSMRPEGQRRLYSLKPDRFQEIDGWLKEYRALWDKRLDRFGDALVARRKTSNEEQS